MIFLGGQSRNIFYLNGTAYIISNKGKRFCGSIVRWQDSTPLITPFKLDDSTQRRSSLESSNLPFQFSDRPPRASSDFTFEDINKFRKFTPETVLFLLFWAKILGARHEKGSGIKSKEAFHAFFLDLTRDTMFLSANAKPLAMTAIKIRDLIGISDRGKADVEIFRKIFQTVERDYRSPDLFGESRDSIDWLFEDRSSMNRFIDILRRIVKDSMLNGTLSKAMVLRIERVFQRSSNTRDYHYPLHDEVIHRWCTVNLVELINAGEMRQKAFLEREDTEVLRDLIANTGKIWIYNKEHANSAEYSSSQVVLVKELFENERAAPFWNDPDRDKLLKGSYSESEDLSLDSSLLKREMNLKIEQLLDVMLLELAKREKINFESSVSNGITEEFEEKWINLAKTQADLWSKLILSQQNMNILYIERKMDEKEAKLPTIVSENPNPNEMGNNSPALDPAPPHNSNIFEHTQEAASDEDFYRRMVEGKQFINKNCGKELSNAFSDDEAANIRQVVEIDLGQVGDFKEASFMNFQPAKTGQTLGQTSEISKNRKIEINRDPKEKIRSERAGNKDQPISHTNGGVNPPDILTKFKRKIQYHSLENLNDARSSTELDEFVFSLSPEGAQLYAVSKDNVRQATLCIYSSETDNLQPIYLQKNILSSSLAIWNAAAFLYFDVLMAKTFEGVGKQMEGHILYADLRETFKRGGTTPGIVVFYPVVKNEDKLINRTIIADEKRIFLLGGSEVISATRNFFTESNLCSCYSFDCLTELCMDHMEGNMKPMQNKRDELKVWQNKNLLFVASKENPELSFCNKILVELYGKDEEQWISQFTVPFESNFLSYEAAFVQDSVDDQEKLVFIVNLQNKKTVGSMVVTKSLEKAIKEEDKKILSLSIAIEAPKELAISAAGSVAQIDHSKGSKSKIEEPYKETLEINRNFFETIQRSQEAHQLSWESKDTSKKLDLLLVQEDEKESPSIFKTITGFYHGNGDILVQFEYRKLVIRNNYKCSSALTFINFSKDNAFREELKYY